MSVFKVIGFKPEHLDLIDEQDATRHISQLVTPAQRAALANHPAYTGMVRGKVVVCAGAVEYWPGRAEAWAYLSRDARPHFLAIHNAVKRFLRETHTARIEAVVDYAFDEGHRWVVALGFVCEAMRMKRYGPTGRDCSLYAKVK